jgi:hypothetical protein
MRTVADVALYGWLKFGLIRKVFHRSIPSFDGLYKSGNQDYVRVLGIGP